MRKIEKLKKQALVACHFRGHKMSKFTTMAVGLGPDDPVNCIAHCVRCGMEVQVLSEPLPNEIDIAGSAVAYGCKEVA